MEMKYIMDRSLTNLEKKVNEYMQKGWSLGGDLKVFDAKYVQTMVKFDYDDLEADGQTKLSDFAEG
tara:strand:+ start:28324 stop:28521 length:198 start_codon:yes stop_codon:yes gene_type:complete